MTIDTMILIAGVFVAVAPFVGLPPSAYGIVYFIVGIVIIGLGIAVRRRGLAAHEHELHQIVSPSAPVAASQHDQSISADDHGTI